MPLLASTANRSRFSSLKLCDTSVSPATFEWTFFSIFFLLKDSGRLFHDLVLWFQQFWRWVVVLPLFLQHFSVHADGIFPAFYLASSTSYTPCFASALLLCGAPWTWTPFPISYKLWFFVTSFHNDSDNDNTKSIVLTSGSHHYTNHLKLRTQFDLVDNNAILLMFVIALQFMYTVYTVYINRKVFLSNILSCRSRDLSQDHFS